MRAVLCTAGMKPVVIVELYIARHILDAGYFEFHAYCAERDCRGRITTHRLNMREMVVNDSRMLAMIADSDATSMILEEVFDPKSAMTEHVRREFKELLPFKEV